MIQSIYQTLRILVIAIVGLFMVDALGAGQWIGHSDRQVMAATPESMSSTPIVSEAPTLGRFVVTARGSKFIAAHPENNAANTSGAPR